jgi:hypothetical protein
MYKPSIIKRVNVFKPCIPIRKPHVIICDSVQDEKDCSLNPKVINKEAREKALRLRKGKGRATEGEEEVVENRQEMRSRNPLIYYVVDDTSEDSSSGGSEDEDSSSDLD